VPPSPSNYRFNPDDPEPLTKDLSFLLHPSFYLPLSQLEVPPQFRIRLEPVSPARPIRDSLGWIDELLQKGDFLLAAHVAAGVLTSPALDPTDICTITDLLSVRYSCLELTGNTLVAAQESKALEDLNSEFYYITHPIKATEQSKSQTVPCPADHILPFQLRLQASRLQAIGFSDPRRGVSALYDLALECREHLAWPRISSNERKLLARRLIELGVRVVNALIDINDLECAKRTLRDLGPTNDVECKVRLGLLLVKVGDISAAKDLLKGSPETLDMLGPLLATAEGRFDDAVRDWENLSSRNHENHLKSIVQQNLAVNYLYAGRLDDARRLMEDAIDNGEGYGTLTFNLATIYELSSEKSRDLKMRLADRVASQKGTRLRSHGKMNADFKL
jgi:trafficking protein particle complex subunit 12